MGIPNVIVDGCSQIWHLTNKQLLTHFNLHYPQNLPWQQCTLQPRMNSTLLSALQMKQHPLELFLLQLQEQRHGGLSGWQNALSGKLTKYKMPVLRTPPTTLRHLLMKYAQEKSPQVVNHGDLEMWKLPYMQLVRQMPYWVQSP